MPLRPLPYHEVERRLRAAEFVRVSQRGSHVKFVKSTNEGTRTAVVPRRRKDVPGGTLGSILRQAGLSAAEFMGL